MPLCDRSLFFSIRANLLPAARRIVLAALPLIASAYGFWRKEPKPPTISSLVFRLIGTSLRSTSILWQRPR